MNVIGLALSIPALADGCITYALRLRSKIQEFKHARSFLVDDLEEYHTYTEHVAVSIRFINDISPMLSDDLKETIRRALFHLSEALQISLDLIERAVDEDGNVKKWKFVLYGRLALEKSLRDVNKRHDIFLRCLHYSVLFGGSEVGKRITDELRLRESSALIVVQRLREAVIHRLKPTKDVPSPKVLLGNNEIPSGLRRRLYSDSAVRIVNPMQQGGKPCLTEYRHYDPADNKSLRRVRDIALILHSTELTMAILPCLGFHEEPQFHRCELVFPLPEGLETARTLRDLLSAPENAQGVRHSLTSRLVLAVRLATAVLYVHSAQLVHKNIRPENIVLLEPPQDNPKLNFPYTLGASFLMGFDFVRKEDEASTRTGDEDWEKNIYRHPERQGTHPEVNFNMLHDVYSLGVVLLEIALWKSFVQFEDVQDGSKYTPNTKACKFVDKTTGRLKSPEDIRKVFVRKAEEHIPLVLGEKYRDVVLMCLNCLDGGFGDVTDLLDGDGVLVGLVFIQRVLTSLEEISI